MKNQFRGMFTKMAQTSSSSFKALFALTTVMGIGQLYASDLDIYYADEADGGTVMLMLDTSGSMACDYSVGGVSGRNDHDYKTYGDLKSNFETGSAAYNLLERNSDTPIQWVSSRNSCQLRTYRVTKKEKDNSVSTIASFNSRSSAYYLPGTGTRFFAESRLTRMKAALIKQIDALSTTEKVAVVGLGHFSNNGDGKTSKIVVPAKKITDSQKLALINGLKNLTARGGTPTAHAYAEVAAYMMGKSPLHSFRVRRSIKGYSVFSRRYGRTVFVPCVSSTNKPFRIGSNLYRKCNFDRYSYFNRSFSADSAVRDSDGITYFFDFGFWNVTNTGFTESVSSSRNGSSYTSPVEKSCSGQAIFFLTDGLPNGSSNFEATRFMNTVLGNPTTADKRVSCSSGWANGGGGSTGAWSCIADFSKILADEKLNPTGKSIQTAVVGLGATFESMTDTDKAEKCVDGSDDAINACKWGADEYGGVGEGAYKAKSAGDIGKAFGDVINATGGIIDPISTGIISIPVDPINSGKPLNIAYLPILIPDLKNGFSTSLWQGNLKKYNVEGGTVKGASGNNVFKSASDSGFEKNTRDLWSKYDPDNNGTADVDEGNGNLGGSRSLIFHKNPSDPTANPRNLFVDDNNGTSLRPLKIDQDTSVPTGFDILSTAYTNKQKGLLAQFLGFDTDPGTTSIIDGEAVKRPDGSKIDFDSDKVVHGAVLHSRPVMLTTSATLYEDETKEDKRNNFILYGSFDGALHLVSEKTGKEKFTFIPHELLKEQGDYLISEEEKIEKGNYVWEPDSKSGVDKYKMEKYGVDASWSIFTQYSSKFTGSGATAATERSLSNAIAFGGLRMGGSSYYALNLTDVDNPKILYRVGSDYGGTNATGATANALPGLKAAFARMGQTWGKVSTGHVQVNGKKVMVNFLPGGYDMRYEDKDSEGNYKPYTATAADPAMGNALYMVQVGEVNAKTDELNLKDEGKLLWWASKNASGATSITSTSVPSLINSIVSEIIPLDRDYDGLTDHLYFSDLGGQVFRADIKNDVGETGTSEVIRVQKVFDVSDQRSESSGIRDSAPRFYESPLVTFMRGDLDSVYAGQIIGVVSIGSGNRSKPLIKRTQDDRIYTFIDYDLAANTSAGKTLFDTAYTLQPTVTESLLSEAKPDDESASVQLRTDMRLKTKYGWYYPLQKYLKQTGTVKGLKAVNGLNAINGYLFAAVFNPNESAISSEGCAAGVKGQTQREILCIPYGACFSRKTEGFLTINRRSEIAGGGIGENYFGFSSVKKKTDGDSDIVDGISIIKQIEEEKCDINDENCDKFAGQFGTTKPLFPLSWIER